MSIQQHSIGRGRVSQIVAPVCSTCGQAAEVKPFGPKGTLVCFACWMADASQASFAIEDDGRWRRTDDGQRR